MNPTPEELATAFVTSMVERADVHDPYPMWYGWALNAAFIAGRQSIIAAAEASDPNPEGTKRIAARAISVKEAIRNARIDELEKADQAIRDRIIELRHSIEKRK